MNSRMDAETGEPSWPYDRGELTADGIVHIVGILFALIGAVGLVATAALNVPSEQIAGAAIYGFCLIATLAMSAAYNMWPVNSVKWVLRRFDHAAIFLLIAGTYTPFALRMDAPYFLAGMWIAAAFGIVLKLVATGKYDRLAVLIYLAMGWSGVAMWQEMGAHLPSTVVWLILVGGLFYSFGVVFHLWQSLRFQNAIWHAFVLCGAVIHFVAVCTSVFSGPVT